MTPKFVPSRRYFACLVVLSGVLVLGIIQWSFLPILIQNGPVGSSGVLEVSAGHSAKFAAPFKGLLGDGLYPSLVQSRIAVRRSVTRMARLPDDPISGQNDFSLTHRPLRAPPAA